MCLDLIHIGSVAAKKERKKIPGSSLTNQIADKPVLTGTREMIQMDGFRPADFGGFYVVSTFCKCKVGVSAFGSEECL